MPRLPSLAASSVVLAALVAADISSAEPVAPTLEQVMERLEALERRNEQLTQQVESLAQQNEMLRAAQAQTAEARAAQPGSSAPATENKTLLAVQSQGPDTRAAQPAGPSNNASDWAERIRFKGDFRFRHENIDNAALTDNRTRETVRARFGAQIKVNDTVEGEIAMGSGGSDPRGGSVALSGTSSRKEFGLDLAYMSWRPLQELTVTAGKMRQPFVRPGLSTFIDNEIRPEGLAFAYQGLHGTFGSAFRYWLEERPTGVDSMMSGTQAGWQGSFGALKLTAGVGYYDYTNVQNQFPGFGNSVLNQQGNTVLGTGTAARFVYDYDIGQIFAEGAFALAHVPVSVFADYARNSAANNGLDTAYNIGFLVGKANAVGRWEAGVYTQQVEKDALFGQWIDSDFAGGVTDNRGQGYRVAWMALKNLLLNVTYLDTEYNVDIGTETDYRRWQLDFNFNF